MSAELVIELVRYTLETVLWMSAPILIAAIVVGLLVGIAQVMTSVQEITIATVPRLATVALAIFLLLPWMLRRMLAFTMQLWGDFHPYVR